MGRPRGFDEAHVIQDAIDVFGQRGYDAVPVDVLIAELGLSRASLYKLYASKHGLFQQALTQVVTTGAADERSRDLILVALAELAPTDEVIRALAQAGVDACFGGAATTVGQRLLARAGLTATG